jgi:magnesium chelatase family protein
MLVKTKGCALMGIEAITITLEVNVSMGQGYNVVGLPDNAVKESMDRTESAIKAIGYHMPRTKLLVNLSPADIKKTGAAFDLPIAIGIMAASEQLNNALALSSYIIMGELGLDGTLYPIKGALAMTIQAKKEGFKGIILPKTNIEEAMIVKDFCVWGFEHLSNVIYFLANPSEYIAPSLSTKPSQSSNSTHTDFNEIQGQIQVKRALTVACAGNHNVLMIGPPGAGKTLLAKSLVSILPPLTTAEALETTNIYSIAGKLNTSMGAMEQRPFRQPHHTISTIALIGGGSSPQPGEISLAHNGVLFLDELPEFKRSSIEVLRQPMEEAEVHISRAKQQVVFPARFLLIAAMNPCPCGYYTHPNKECVCSPTAIRNYVQKISGPLLDRIDIQIEVAPLLWDDLIRPKIDHPNETDTAEIIERARIIQLSRYQNNQGKYTNSQLSNQEINTYCNIPIEARELLKAAMEQFQLSARAYSRILKLSRTIADLEGKSNIEMRHVSEAIQYRNFDSANWGKCRTS